uniref:hypothetical protein n=1 Tax=Amycolatopsis sp. CA-290885 TaxID=3239925 RepID=UPI003F4932B4
MSLTSELADARSTLSAWCSRTLSGTPAVVAEVEQAVHGVRPVRPRAQQVSREHWAQIGGALGQRLADLVQPAPPYYALLGLVRAGWASWPQAHELAAQYPTHRDLPPEYRARALDIRPAAGEWLDLGGPGRAGSGADAAAAAVWGELLQRYRRYLAAHAPVGTLGNPGAERGLARICWLISAAEDIYRSGKPPEQLQQLFDRGTASVDTLRGVVDEQQVEELVELAEQLHARNVVWQLRKLAGTPGAGEPLGIAAPTIVPGWADGDLLLGGHADAAADGQGSTLLDVKTVMGARDQGKVARWLWQVLFYAWLDTADLYRIRRVGLLLARHGVLITWPVEELAAGLLGHRDFGDRYREQACAVAEKIISSHGLQFPVA